MAKKRNENHDAQRRSKGQEMPASSEKQALALRCAKEGIPVVPLHGTKNDHCTCGKRDCRCPGAHARTENDVFDATTDAEVVSRMWEKWPKAKIGIGFGGPSKLVGVAIDGEAGRKTLRGIERHGELQPTVTVRDHDREIRLYKVREQRPLRGEIAAGIRILGEGDFIIGPSSLTGSGGGRSFAPGRQPWKVAIAAAPVWLFEERGPDAPSSSQAPVAAPSVVLVRASEIEPERIGWIWPGVIARGRITGVVGHPGLGKSQVAIDVAATVSTGRRWPGGAANGNAGEVIILSAEDDAADTVVPRLIAAGANLTGFHVVKAVTGDDGIERAFSIAVDLDRLEKEYDLQRVRLLIVDPVSAYLSTAKSTGISRNHGADVRTVLGRFAAFASRHDLGVLAVSHLNKSTASRAITRAMGSQEWVAVPRAVFLVTEEAGSSRRLFLPLKNNLAPDRAGYAFEIQGKVVAPGISSSAVVWSDDLITVSADEALAAAAKKVTSGATEFLRELLNDGPRDQAEIVRLGKEAGFTEKTLRTAREKLGVTPKKEGFGPSGKWVWVPAGGATVIKLVVDNRANGHTAGSGDKTVPDADHAQDPGTVPEPGNPESGPEKPPESDAT